MRIRKNAKLSPLLFTCSSSLLQNPSFPLQTFQTHVCQLNQSPWDVIPFHSSNNNSIQLQDDEDRFKNGDSFRAVDESVNVVASMMETEDVVNNEPAIENFDTMMFDDNNNNNQHGGGGSKKVGLKRSSNGGGIAGPGPRRRGRPRKSVPTVAGSSGSNSSSNNNNNNEFYYYSGFGPLWGKRRGDKNEGEDNNVGDDNKVSVGDNKNNVGIEFGCGVDVNVVPCVSEMDYEEEEDYYDDYCDNGKRRMRKPVKERSLKSLM